MGIGLAQHVATESVFLVTDAQLSEQGGGKVCLITDALNTSGRLDGTAHPDHRNMVPQWMEFVDILVVDAVIRQHDDQCVIPYG